MNIFHFPAELKDLLTKQLDERSVVRRGTPKRSALLRLGYERVDHLMKIVAGAGLTAGPLMSGTPLGTQGVEPWQMGSGAICSVRRRSISRIMQSLWPSLALAKPRLSHFK